jgi:hypothetical protein
MEAASKQAKLLTLAMTVPRGVLGLLWLFLDEAADLLQAAATCLLWRSTNVESDAWRTAFVRVWSRRQKSEFVRKCWQQLHKEGFFPEPAGLSITSSPIKLLENWEPWKPNPCAADPDSTWYRRFVTAAWDMWSSSLPTFEELCFDSCHDELASQNFPRCWCLPEGDEIEDVRGAELQFHPDGSVNAHDGCPWRWRWWGAHRCQWSHQVHSHLRLWRRTWDNQYQTIDFHFCRSADAGFVMVSTCGITMCSREKTIQEHIYRRYGGEPSCPSFVQKALQDISDAEYALNVQLPSELTSFERLCAHKLADRLGLNHLSSGVGLSRSIKIFARGGPLHRPRPGTLGRPETLRRLVPTVHAVIGQQGLEWPTTEW